jgi:hypothetical protein
LDVVAEVPNARRHALRAKPVGKAEKKQMQAFGRARECAAMDQSVASVEARIFRVGKTLLQKP